MSKAVDELLHKRGELAERLAVRRNLRALSREGIL